MSQDKIAGDPGEAAEATQAPVDAPVESKVAAGGVAGAVTVVLVYIASELGLEIPPEVASAFTTLIAFGAGYLKGP